MEDQVKIKYLSEDKRYLYVNLNCRQLLHGMTIPFFQMRYFDFSSESDETSQELHGRMYVADG